MNRLRYLLPALTLAVATPGMAFAQAPGYQQLNPGAVRAEYTAEVLDRVNDLHEDWSQAWSTDEPEELVKLYWEEAVLIPYDRAPLRGHEQLRAYFDEVLPTHGQVEGFMLDFDASGGMGTIYGNYLVQLQGSGGQVATRRQGPLVTVYLRRGRTWKIRTQVFVAPSG